MYALKNKVQLIGHVGNQPDIRNTENGKKLARFSVATNEVYRNAKGDKITETQWHNLVAWGKVAELAEKYLGKGSEVAIEGKLINRNYTDKEGNKKYVTEVQVNEVLLLGSSRSSNRRSCRCGFAALVCPPVAKFFSSHMGRILKKQVFCRMRREWSLILLKCRWLLGGCTIPASIKSIPFPESTGRMINFE
jgi:single-strand DNA-binding protein